MEIKEYEAEYSYDYNLDVVNIEVKQNSPHKETVELEFGVFLDFNQNDIPINLEIISASKILNVDKKLLCSPSGQVKVIIGEDIIEVNVCFDFNNNREVVIFKTINDFSILASHVNFALA